MPADGSETLWWDDDLGAVCLIDQTALPSEFRVITCTGLPRLITAIQRLEVRGAPALGVAGAFGVALAARLAARSDPGNAREQIQEWADSIRTARPTAVNLAWGTDRVLSAAMTGDTAAAMYHAAIREAAAVADEDLRACRALGEAGKDLLPARATVLTHCNAGALACRGWGTAIGVIRSAIRSGKDIRLVACETRPLLQGARLTAWECTRDHIPVTVVPDSAAAFLMRKGEIDAVIVGADRVTRDAVFNKIGTYMHAVCARHHGIPFYVAAPHSTFDRERSEADITIEERGRDEMAVFAGLQTIPDEAVVWNPAFDATPLALVTAIITETGVLYPPYAIQGLPGSP